MICGEKIAEASDWCRACCSRSLPTQTLRGRAGCAIPLTPFPVNFPKGLFPCLSEEETSAPQGVEGSVLHVPVLLGNTAAPLTLQPQCEPQWAAQFHPSGYNGVCVVTRLVDEGKDEGNYC